MSINVRDTFIISVLLGLLLCVICIADDTSSPIDVNATRFSTFDYVTYYAYTGKKIKISWDASNGTVKQYRIQAFLVEQNRYVWEITGSANTTSCIYTFDRSGHYIFRVRAENSKGHSRWISSNNATRSTVNGKHRAWWVYTYVAPPSDINLN